MVDIDDEDVQRLRIALARISRTIDRQVAGDGMTRTQLSTLGTIARAKSLRLAELAEIEGLNPTMLSRIVGKLEDAGLVRRTADDQDRRVVSVAITAAGSRLHGRLRRERAQLLTDRLAELPSAQVTALSHAIPALESLAAGLRPVDAVPATVAAGR